MSEQQHSNRHSSFTGSSGGSDQPNKTVAPPTPLLTPQQAANLDLIQNVTFARIALKYRRGQEQHGGNLWDRPILKDLADEVTDLNCYQVTLEQKVLELRRFLDCIHAAVTVCLDRHATSVLCFDNLREVETMLLELDTKLNNL